MSTGVMNQDRIGAYRIVRGIYMGATSVVMEVIDESGRRFALKELLESRASDPEERREFEREAKLGLALRHPNLIRYHEYVRDKSQPYFVMDYFKGHHLRLTIAKPKEYPIAPGGLHTVIGRAASALAYMHGQGWVHRDVKPENIMINRSLETRVIDYTLTLRIPSGLGKLISGRPKCQGTPTYMSPEQILREPPAISADVYSLGITCYELACGRPPFRANSQSELLRKQREEAPLPPTTHNPAVTSEFSDLVLRMIRKKPADRIPDLNDFLARWRRIRIFRDDPTPAD
ncbi:MAG: serine/threonine-protein kinase [Isosphaeraceae bacterium]|nr:serine/threonine-protein kinase [Isosphaeraceae bacterium]